MTINGREVRSVDPTSGAVDVTGYVRPGRNLLSIRVATTLFNAASSGAKDCGVLGVEGRVHVEIQPKAATVSGSGE